MVAEPISELEAMRKLIGIRLDTPEAARLWVEAYRRRNGCDPKTRDVQRLFPTLSRTTCWRRIRY